MTDYFIRNSNLLTFVSSNDGGSSNSSGKNMEDVIKRMVMLAYLEQYVVKKNPARSRDANFVFGQVNDMLVKDDQVGISGPEIELLHEGVIKCNDLLVRLQYA